MCNSFHTTGVQPGNSTYSPRKSKHTAPTFNKSKRTHGLGKLAERTGSEGSGDTTMREIDMFIGEDLSVSGASGSFGIPTDENVSPVLSSSLTRFNRPTKFQGSQVTSHCSNCFRKVVVSMRYCFFGSYNIY